MGTTSATGKAVGAASATEKGVGAASATDKGGVGGEAPTTHRAKRGADMPKATRSALSADTGRPRLRVSNGT